MNRAARTTTKESTSVPSSKKKFPKRFQTFFYWLTGFVVVLNVLIDTLLGAMCVIVKHGDESCAQYPNQLRKLAEFLLTQAILKVS